MSDKEIQDKDLENMTGGKRAKQGGEVGSEPQDEFRATKGVNTDPNARDA